MPNIMLTTGCSNDKYNNMRVSFNEKKAQFTLPSGVKTFLNWELFKQYLVIYYQNTSQSYTHITPNISTPFGQKPSDTFTFLHNSFRLPLHLLSLGCLFWKKTTTSTFSFYSLTLF